MNDNKTFKLIESLALTLIISYFFIHKILLVLIGITFSLYLINYNIINNTIIKKLEKKKISNETNIYHKDIKSDSSKTKLDEENSKLTLVERIEEIGYIPVLDDDNDSSAA